MTEWRSILIVDHVLRLLQLKTIFSISSGSATGNKMNFLNRGIYMILNVAASEIKLQIEYRVPPIPYIYIYNDIYICIYQYVILLVFSRFVRKLWLFRAKPAGSVCTLILFREPKAPFLRRRRIHFFFVRVTRNGH